MAEAGLFIGWGVPVRGREKRALDLFNGTMQYYGRLQQDGKIERFDVAVLAPHGSDLAGFALMQGTGRTPADWQGATGTRVRHRRTSSRSRITA